MNQYANLPSEIEENSISYRIQSAAKLSTISKVFHSYVMVFFFLCKHCNSNYITVYLRISYVYD